jgi:hypothetical protein
MGTSQSNPGPKGESPLIPPWADDQPGQPQPEPDPNRFRAFRLSLGNFVKNGNRKDLESALGAYARKSSGGGSVASRRMGPVNQAGAGLFMALAGTGTAGQPGERPINLADLAGQPCEVAIAAIVNALTPENGDADKIRTAMNHALVEALDGIETFDMDSITDEVIVNIIIGYLAECIFLQIVMDGGDAWKRADTPAREGAASEDLWELIKVVVDKNMAPKFSGGARTFTRKEILQIERQLIQDVWNEWKDYE